MEHDKIKKIKRAKNAVEKALVALDSCSDDRAEKRIQRHLCEIHTVLHEILYEV